MIRCVIICALIALAISVPVRISAQKTESETNSPMIPRVTFPYGSVRTLTPSIAWFGAAHDACEVVIAAESQVWSSGIIETADSHVVCEPLPPDSHLTASVRTRRNGKWSEWSAPATFRTPPAPVVRILQPVHAGRAKAPRVEFKWEVESPVEIQSQLISVDGGEWNEIAPEDRTFEIDKLAEGLHRAAISVKTADGTANESVSFYVYKSAQLSAQTLYHLDLRWLHDVDLGDASQAAQAFDTLHLAAVLQGVVNAETPRLYINYTAVDDFWLEKITADGAYLEHCTNTQLESVEAAVQEFRDHIKGVVVWDPQVPATCNVASTICGVEGLIPVRYDESPESIYSKIVTGGPRLKAVHNLVGKFTGTGIIADTDRESTGSAKCDAYIWAKIKYLDSGKCNPLEMGYYCDAFWLQCPTEMSLDNVGISNHDFIVSRKGFICDLNVWTDESPRDDPNQEPGTDRRVFQEILLSCYTQGRGKMIHICGFTPWAMKYTIVGNAGGTHDGVPTEWEMVRLVSAYNGYLNADAIGYVGMANASVYSKCPLPDRLVQNPPPSRADLEAKGYLNADGDIADRNFIYHYLGDYDSAAWMYNRLPAIWQNPARGDTPAGWAFNPSLSERIPAAFEWFYESKSPVDYFVAGDSGAGYVNPTQLLPPRDPSGLPSAADAWIEHNSRYYRKLNYSITTFLINGFAGALTDESNRIYLPFSGNGVMTQLQWMPAEKKHDHIIEWMPVAGMKQDITAPIDVVVQAILNYGKPGETQFLSFRSILSGSDWIKTVNEGIRNQKPDCRFEPVDPYTYFFLLRHSLGGDNEKRATFTFDTLPAQLKPGERIRIAVGIRNDGWETWKASGPLATVLCAGFGERASFVQAQLDSDVASGEAAVVEMDIVAPSESGKHAFSIDLRQGSDDWFEDAGNLPWCKMVEVVSASK